MAKKRTINYEIKTEQILNHLDSYHDTYYEKILFDGPSLYFHLRTLNIDLEKNYMQFLECIYATLTSWGMHRMGSKGSKMVDFKIFYRSLENEHNNILHLRTKYYSELTETDWEEIRRIFDRLKIMASGTRLVGNSKVMAHLFPNLIAPIDREYTIYFLTGNKYINTSSDHEWNLLKDIMIKLFYKVASDKRFQSKAHRWMNQKEKFPWDTSPLKIIDNLIIGAGLYKKFKDNQT